MSASLLFLMLAACSPASAPTAPASGPTTSPTGTPGPSSIAASPAAASPSASASAAGPAATPPEFEGAPLWVLNREPLPFCGLEEQPEEVLDLEARQCFFDAAAAGEPAEMVVRAITMEGGLVHFIFRTTPGNPFEQIIDGTGDSFGSGRWERQVCIRMTRGDPVAGDPVGELNFGFDSCEDATPPL